MAELFGYKITKSKEEGGISFTAPTSDDGAIDIAGGGFFSSYLNTDGKERTDLDLIQAKLKEQSPMNLMRCYDFSSLTRKVMIFFVGGMLMDASIIIKLLTKKIPKKE